MTQSNAEKRKERRIAQIRRRKQIHLVLAAAVLGLCLLTAGIFAVKALSGDTYHNEDGFKEYADTYYEENPHIKNVGTAKESVHFGTPLSTAMKYPVTGQENTDAYIKEMARGLETQFKNDYKDAGEKEQIAMLVDYEAYKTKREAIGVTFFTERLSEEGWDMKPVALEAHTYNFSTKTGLPLAEIQIFKAGYKKSCAQKLDAFLQDQYGRKLTENYQKVLTASAVNLNDFVLTEKGVRFYFMPGTVLDEEEGIVTAELSYQDLKGILRDKIAVRLVDPDKPMVALTFDDGPFPRTTNRILDCLEKYGAVATFFELGQNVSNYPKVVAREAKLGMEVGSHSWSHPNLANASDKQVKAQIDKTNKALEKACGHKAAVFRPPYGNNTKVIKKYAGAPIILWSVDTLDWKSRKAKSVMKVVKGVKKLDGQVILMHSIYDSSAEAVEKMVPWLIDNGYQLVTVSELLRYRYDETPKNGKLYGYNYFAAD